MMNRKTKLAAILALGTVLAGGAGLAFAQTAATDDDAAPAAGAGRLRLPGYGADQTAVADVARTGEEQPRAPRTGRETRRFFAKWLSGGR